MRPLSGLLKSISRIKVKKIKGYTEQEVIDLLLSIIDRLAPKYIFGIYDVEDIKQEAFLIGMEWLKSYKNQAALGAYLYTVLKSKLHNFKRDNTTTHNISCSYCTKFNENCESCANRKANQDAKYNLLYPIDISRVREDGERNLQINDYNEEVDEKELLRKVDTELPKEYRKDYLKIMGGLYVSKKRRMEIELKILNIVGEND